MSESRASPHALVTRARQILHEMVRFGVVGSLAFVVDLTVFNALRYEGEIWSGPLSDKPITAKVISVGVATMVAYAGNRHWTWRDRARRGARREIALFLLFNLAGMLIAVGCLTVSHYLLGFTSALADNISANGVGLALGTTFRFWSYRRWVFPLTVAHEHERTQPPAATTER